MRVFAITKPGLITLALLVSALWLVMFAIAEKTREAQAAERFLHGTRRHAVTTPVERQRMRAVT